MKKFLPLVLIALLLTGCGSDDVVKIGTIKYLNITEEALDNIRGFEHSQKHRHIFFENLSSMLAAIKAGQIDEISIYETVALQIVARNPDLQWDISDYISVDSFSCGMREEDAELKDKFDNAIKTISEDGTLAKIVKVYIDESTHTDEPLAVNMPAFYGAETIKIGVTGDLPVFDYIRADGKPAGFNTAVLAEISRLIGKNFVLVQIESGARAAALTSKQVDVIFWAIIPQNYTNVPANFDIPDGMILTKSYFADEIVHMKIRE